MLVRSFFVSAFFLVAPHLLTTSAATAQESTTTPSISVSGSAVVRVVPDEISLTFGIETVDTSVDAVRQRNEALNQELLKIIKKLNIEDRRVQSGTLLLEPLFEDAKTFGSYSGPIQTRVSGYRMRRDVSVRLNDFALFDQLVSSALKAGVNRLENLQTSVTDVRKYRDQARREALRAARDKATAMAEELGVTLGKPLSISENALQQYGGLYGARNAAMFQNSLSAAPTESPTDDTPTAPGEIAISASVSVVFGLGF